MNKKTASVLVGILVIGIVSAGLVPYLSNMVSGSVEVSGPVFYAIAYENQKETIFSSLGDEIKAYLLDTDYNGDLLKNFDISINCTEALGSGCEAKFMRFFTTKELGIDYFYNSNWEFHTNLRILDKTNPDGNCRVYTKLFKMHEESEVGVYDELVDGRNNPTDVIPLSLQFGDMISEFNLPHTEMLPEDRFYVEYWTMCDYGEYNLRFRIGQDKTRIEVSAT